MLALVATIAAAKVAFWFRPMKPRPVLATTTAALLVALALPGMVEAGNHVHSHGTPGQAVVVGADGKAQVVTAYRGGADASVRSRTCRSTSAASPA